MSTDKDWKKWGAIDPYFGVYSDEKYRMSALNEEARTEFFQSGEAHVKKVIATIRNSFDPAFAPSTALDFGSGVGRMVIAMARRMTSVLGVDISPSMIAEASKNCERSGVHNVRFAESSDTLSNVDEAFDLVHSHIVLPHIPWRRGRKILQSLAERVRRGGYLVVQILTGSSESRPVRGLIRLRYWLPPVNWIRNLLRSRPLFEPAMQLNIYDLRAILDDLQERGFDTPLCVEENWGKYTSTMLYVRRRA